MDSYACEIFLSHSWEETSKEEHETHKIVKRINKLLLEEGLESFYMESLVTNSIIAHFCRMINAAHIFTPIITRQYLEALENEEDHCSMELLYALQTKKTLMPIVLDPSLKVLDTWPDGFGKQALSRFLLFDLTSKGRLFDYEARIFAEMVIDCIDELNNPNEEIVVAKAYDIAAMKEAKDFPALIQSLSDGNNVTRAKAAIALGNLALEEEDQTAMVELGVIPALISIITVQAVEGHKDPKKYLTDPITFGTAALRNFSQRPENKTAIAEGGGVKSLLELLTHGTDVGKFHAVAVINSLACDRKNRVWLATLEAIAPLVLHLREGTEEEGKLFAAEALANLATNSANKITIANYPGAISVLSQVIQDESGELQAQAAGCVRNLAINRHNQKLLNDRTLLNNLLNMVSSENAEGRLQAAWALFNLTADNDIAKFLSRSFGLSRSVLDKLKKDYEQSHLRLTQESPNFNLSVKHDDSSEFDLDNEDDVEFNSAPNRMMTTCW